jgi:hypothetical protein
MRRRKFSREFKIEAVKLVRERAIHDFIVPNGCSTVWRRRRIFAGFRSSLACTASRMASCSQREIRRSLPVVHWPFSAQPWHALVQ